MSEHLPILAVAPPMESDPARILAVHYRRLLAERMADRPYLNPALQVATTTFRRVGGDWLGCVVTPWSLNLVLVNGGGRLWQDMRDGERRLVRLPVGELEFIADAGETSLVAWQYCPFIAPVKHIPDMEHALIAAREALATVLAPPSRISPEPDFVPETAPESRVQVPETPAPRRGFLRGLFGGD